MNTERIIEDQVELYVLEQQMPLTYADPLRNALRRAVEQARQQEREECLKICLDYNRFYWMATHGGLKCAELIKERNNECLTAPSTKTRRNGESSRLGQNRKNG